MEFDINVVNSENDQNILDRFDANYSELKLLSRIKLPSKIRRVGLTFNARPDDNIPESDNVSLEYDEPETIFAIRDALQSGGYDVVLLEADQDFMEKLKQNQVDFVFNIAEGIQGESRESHIPAMLEMMGIPYTGSGVLSQAISLSKTRTKEILTYYKIPTPKYQSFSNSTEKLEKKFKYPVIIKPDAEGSSVGITNGSVVLNEKHLRQQVEKVIQTFPGPALAEEFCSGREFTVGIIGNNPPKVLPIIEVTFDHLPSNMVKMDSYESKWIFDTIDNVNDPLRCPAKITPKLKQIIENIAIKTYTVLGCVDLCRIDIRLNKRGIPNVLEVNALPGLNPNPSFHSRFPYACAKAGISYDQMILTVFQAGLDRYRKKNM
ncbi:D-alanine--D-alanine ligase [Promethearchaeum syntrophicum]|uniref:D-alanine--D-alanine ligase n=1 Tax=Promethearchaeum syntrophicum TaxID=2594042 RepID=A0A5B9DCC8_9ARCH|nr:D-alanine--D-alanine ligase [Candidatus Prometheoarchaeum syntrophicum]QEE16410.1 D-alanine--D-alanine ligase [Candidatus Prometheoarchaeum syntrophicum]